MILIIGGGIGGLTLALNLHRAGIPCQIFEAAQTIKPLGVGINILPHAMKELSVLELGSDIAANAIETHEVCFYNRFGQHIYTEPRGRFAGYEWPQFSIHRGPLRTPIDDNGTLRTPRQYRGGPSTFHNLFVRKT